MRHFTPFIWLSLTLFSLAACQQPPAEPAASFPTFINGRYAYAPAPTGIKVIDIQTPTQPKVVGELATAGRILHTQIYGDHLYAIKSGGWHPSTGADVPAGIIIASLTDPTRPERIHFLPSDDTALELLVTNNYLFVSNWQRTKIYDVSNLAEPPIGETITGRIDAFVQTAADTLYAGWGACSLRQGICQGGVRHMEFDPETGKPTLIENYPYGQAGAQNLVIHNGLFYIFGDRFIIAEENQLANPPPPIQGETMSGTVIGLQDEIVFTTVGTDINSYDLSAPPSPTHISTAAVAPLGTYFIEATLQDRYAYLISDYGFHVIDVSYPGGMFGAGYVALDG